ncbi:MAG: metallophosphoesterase family protein [Promethearchaeota archaeon]
MSEMNEEQVLIGLISDTHVHSNFPTILNKIIDDFKEKKIDYLIHLGDYTSYTIYENFQNIFSKEKFIGIKGNMDDSNLKEELPEKMELELFGHKIFITHGEGGPHNIIKLLNRRFDLSNYDVIIFGHAHRPFNETWEDGKLYINPGSPTDKRFTKINSYGYLKLSHEKIEPEIIYL